MTTLSNRGSNQNFNELTILLHQIEAFNLLIFATKEFAWFNQKLTLKIKIHAKFWHLGREDLRSGILAFATTISYKIFWEESASHHVLMPPKLLPNLRAEAATEAVARRAAWAACLACCMSCGYKMTLLPQWAIVA